MRRTLVLLIFSLWPALPQAAAAADAVIPQGDVVVAKTQGAGVILWDVTPSVAAIVAAAGGNDEKMRDLEIDAAKILLDRLNEMQATSTVEVRVFYQKIGDVSPIYRANTFGGVEKLFTVRATTKAASADEAAWRRQLASGTLPNAVSAIVTGDLPPQQ